MLLQMRTFTRSIVAYLLLFVLVIAFAMWGINGWFQRVGAQNVAEVGGKAITPTQLGRELDLTLRAQRRQGNNVSQEDAVRAGVHTRILDSLITRTALFAYAEKLGVVASDALVAARIREIPSVHNPVTNAFDPSAYAQFLHELGYTQPDFENDIRTDETTKLLLEPMTAGIRAPSSYGALAVVFGSERRVISIAEAPSALVGQIPAANEAELHDLYQDNQESLRLPEYRALTLVYARPSDFMARVNIPEQRLREEFESHRAASTTPEKRTFIRITAQNEAQARDLAARLSRGEAPEAVARSANSPLGGGNQQARTQVTDENVAAAVFSMPAGQPRVVRGQLAPWVVVRVDAITPSVAPTFESMRDQIRAELAQDEAADLLTAATSQFQEARDGGAAIAQAARTANLVVVNVPMTDAQGRDRDGHPVEALTGHAELLSTAFQTQEGEASDFMPVDEADVIVSVDHVTPAAVRPFAEVRTQLAAAWVERERVRRLQELGQDVVQAVAHGQTFAAATRQRHIPLVITSRPIDRRSAAQIPARRLAGEIFGGREGDVVVDMRADGGALLIAVVEDIQRIDPAQASQQVEAARGQAEEALRNSLAEAITSEITARSHPRRNQALINQLYPHTSAGEDDPQQ